MSPKKEVKLLLQNFDKVASPQQVSPKMMGIIIVFYIMPT